MADLFVGDLIETLPLHMAQDIELARAQLLHSLTLEPFGPGWTDLCQMACGYVQEPLESSFWEKNPRYRFSRMNTPRRLPPPIQEFLVSNACHSDSLVGNQS
jgi:hypothetical protein